MRVVLRADIDGLGRRGDIVNVAGGYARNSLFPAGQAIVATDGITAQASSMRRARDLREARDREAAEAQAAALQGTVITIASRAGSAGRLFGSVSASDIVEQVRSQTRVELDRESVLLKEPIKTVGSNEVTVRLLEDVEVTLAVEVVAAT